MRKNLYRHPEAANAWSTHCDIESLRLSNTDQLSCHQAEMGPCLFHLVRNGKTHGRVVSDNMRLILENPEVNQAWVSIHTDNLGAAGTSDAILDFAFKPLDER